MILLQVLEADLQVQLPSPHDNVLPGLLNDALHHGVRLGQPLQTFHQLGQAGRVLGLHSDPDNRAHTELHHPHVVGMLEGGDGASLHQELVHAHQAHNVATRHILDRLHVMAHHQDCPLDQLQVQVLLLPRSIVGSHDADLQASRHQLWTRPKAQNRPLAEVGTILEMYIMRGPLGSQLLMPIAASSSGGPSYRSSRQYFWAVTGDGSGW